MPSDSEIALPIGAVDLADALEFEHALVEGGGLFEVGHLDGDVSDLAHDAVSVFPLDE